MEETCNSNGTSDYELKSATLDQLYKEQVADLRDLVLKNSETADIDICRKWLKVFNRTKAKKVTRNCLCTLMQQQIKEFGCLAEPFTNLNNCNRDLECVLNELDDASQINTTSFRTGSAATYKSHGTFNEPPFTSKNVEVLKDCQYNEFNAERLRMQRELEILRLQISEKHIENGKLKEMVDKYRRESEKNEEILDNIKSKIVNCIRDRLLDLGHYGVVTKHLKLFESTFEIHSNDSEFMKLLRKFDLDFQHILSKHVECEFKKYKTTTVRQICLKFLKKKSRLHQKYERRLTMQAMTQRLQLKLAKLKCISELRQIFIRSHSEVGKVDLWEILNTLEEKYEGLANGL